MKVTKQDMRWMNEPDKWKQKDDEIKMTCPMEVSFACVSFRRFLL
jgi:regulation of enolase protein 1 (concanavalin A-like superfamily)